jgi:hypothetical protein
MINFNNLKQVKYEVEEVLGEPVSLQILEVLSEKQRAKIYYSLYEGNVKQAKEILDWGKSKLPRHIPFKYQPINNTLERDLNNLIKPLGSDEPEGKNYDAK